MSTSQEFTLDISDQMAREFCHNNNACTSEPSRDLVIAPFLAPDEKPKPPTPPPRSPGRSGFTHKQSYTSFVVPRQQSVSNFFSGRNGRPSESHSIAESINSQGSTGNETPTEPQPLRKTKSTMGMFTTMLKKTRSRGRLRSETDHLCPYSQSQTFLSPPQDSMLSLPMVPPPPNKLKREKTRESRRKGSALSPTLPPVKPEENGVEHPLDTNIDNMDGIVDFTVVVVPNNLEYNSSQNSTSSPESPFSSPQTSVRDHSASDTVRSRHATPEGQPVFHNPNPFNRKPINALTRRPIIHLDYRKISPKTVLPSSEELPYANGNPESPTWIAPESWAVDKDSEEDHELDQGSSDDEAMVGNRLPAGLTTTRRRSRRRTARLSIPPSVDYKAYKIRIYRANGSHHICSVALSITVADLTPILNRKLRLEGAMELHRLYMKEKGRERVLAPTEKPADIVRRRLEQAGFEPADNLHLIGKDDLSYLLRFEYKTQLLGGEDTTTQLDSYEYVDLTGRSLRAIPVTLHQNPDNLVKLSLARNPMLEIPLDFIQACVTLRELRLSHMAMKKVPQSVRHSLTLQILDISCNRIVDLDDAGLDRIPELRSLKAQNNRMEKLPWYFPRLRCLKYLNISNNKFKHLPAVVSEMASLLDLDISFNMISELPEEIGQLKCLEQLIIVGNRVSRLPAECANLESLRVLDCRRNLISDLSIICMLPKLEILRADHNAVHGLDLSLGPNVVMLDASHNEITKLTLAPPHRRLQPYALRSLDISHAKLSSLDDLVLSQFSSLQSLKIDHNSIRFIPESLGKLSQLTLFSCSDNELGSLPSSIGRLQRLEMLDTHNNSLMELPASLWNCASLSHINATSNLIGAWHPPLAPTASMSSCASLDSFVSERKSSVGSAHSGRHTPPLAYSLERLYLGENQFTDSAILPLTVLKELRVLNLSFNDLQDIPANFFRGLTKLEELYLSGNMLGAIPTEDLHRLNLLSVLFLNGNRLKTLPGEIRDLRNLAVLDVGSNILRYNINNLEFDWNWNFNENLRYLNFSGNKRLEIKPDTSHPKSHPPHNAEKYSDFSGLKELRVLGLMDVTTTFVDDVPDDNEERRVRTSLSTVNTMAYGIADNIGKHMGKFTHLTMLDLVQPEFRDHKDEAIFAMFGRSQSVGSDCMSKFLHDNFVAEFAEALKALDHERGEGVPDAIRRTFLHLNKTLHDTLYDPVAKRKMSSGGDGFSNTFVGDSYLDLRSGVSGIVLYLAGKTMYIANAGDALAVISRRGSATALSRKHDPFDRQETARIRAAEGWVTPKGCVNDDVDVSRSFGYYHLFPVVNARPDICTWELSNLDEFVIIGNRGLWDYVDYQTAVDIARSERSDPMIAAQKLRDFAISYGAEGSTMIMVISVGDLFTPVPRRPTTDGVVEVRRARKKDEITIRNITRLDEEVSPPTGHVALVFTDIRNSTHLWEVNPGMPTAMRLHNNLLRRQLRFCGGYEVKTEGDAFMCSFPTALSALWWCMAVQSELLKEPWPLEILECEDGKEIGDSNGEVICRGLSVRMGVHCGHPLCEPDPITKRMDYFGPMVNRSSRISARAAGGQIMVSAEIVREINAKILKTGDETEYSDAQTPEAIHAIKALGCAIVSVGEVKLKGLEVPETLSLVYPKHLAPRHDLEEMDSAPSASHSRVPFCVDQIRELAVLCVRLEMLSTGRIFRSISERKKSLPRESHDAGRSTSSLDIQQESRYVYGDPALLIPNLSPTASDADMTMILESLSLRIMNVVPILCLEAAPFSKSDNGGQKILDALARRGPLDDDTLAKVLAALDS